MRKTRNLWAPWRISYIQGPKPEGCIFCRIPEKDRDRENLVVFRGERIYAILNRYPYTAGHLMVVPNRHASRPGDLTAEEASELWNLLVRSQQALDAVFHPHGYNVGLNLGKVAGAGIDEHLHLHVVPRWAGDTNFLPVLDDVRLISQHLLDMYDALVPAFRSQPSGTCERERS
jgi:ATP adenylyltransferase